MFIHGQTVESIQIRGSYRSREWTLRTQKQKWFLSQSSVVIERRDSQTLVLSQKREYGRVNRHSGHCTIVIME